MKIFQFKNNPPSPANVKTQPQLEFYPTHCYVYGNTWRHHQMETFSSLLGFCAGNWSAIGELTAQRPVTQSLDVFFFDVRLNQQLSQQWRRRWFETPLRSLWHYHNVLSDTLVFLETKCLLPFHSHLPLVFVFRLYPNTIGLMSTFSD